jgi:hypothetical protein
MKTGLEKDVEDLAPSADGEPASPGIEEPTEASKERDLDELRRFRVRTVPPDMRRQWILAEEPVVSTLELQDTLPPNKRPSSAPPEPRVAPPQPLFNAPRVSSTAATRRLPRVVPRSERAMMVGATAVGLALAMVLIGLVWRGLGSRAERVAPRPTFSGVDDRLPTSQTQSPTPSPQSAALEVPPSSNSSAGVEPRSNAPATARRPRAEPGPKPPSPTQPASGKTPPAQKARTDRDIKSPLFGK